MKHIKKIAPIFVLALLVAGIAWACKTSNKSASAQADAAKCPYASSAQAKAGACPYATQAAHAKMVEAGGHCSGVGTSAGAMAQQCGLKANQVMYSFAVPGAECTACIDAIQKAAAHVKGIECAHVDLSTHTAYIITDKGVTQATVAKCIQGAGFRNTFKGTGTKVHAAFIEAMKNGAKNGMSCCPLAKEKDKA
jgi:copper chaperone CopZ